jgi:hypothetical protein
MRILVAGDRYWQCNELAAGIIRRLVARYGPDIVIVHGDATGVDESFDMAARGLGVATEPHPADWDRFGRMAGPLRNEAMFKAGAELCIVVHRFLPGSKGTRDCARKTIAAGIPTYLVDSAKAMPKRLRGDDPRLEL